MLFAFVLTNRKPIFLLSRTVDDIYVNLDNLSRLRGVRLLDR